MPSLSNVAELPGSAHEAIEQHLDFARQVDLLKKDVAITGCELVRD